MDNFNLSNLPLLRDCADSAELDPWLTAEQNTRVTFSGRSAARLLDQAELQQLSLTYEEQISEQRVLADFDISFPNTPDSGTFDESEDPFVSLASYRPLTFDDNSIHPSGSELVMDLGLFEGFAGKDLMVFIKAEPEGNDVLEQPEQAQYEPDTAGVINPESANPNTDTDKRSGKLRALEPRDLVTRDLPESVINKSPRRSDRLARKRQKLASTDTEFLQLARGKATKRRAATMPEKSRASRKKTKRLDSGESLRHHVNEETNKWIVESKGSEKRFICGSPDCGYTSNKLYNLQTHIFSHIHISVYRCTYPECGDNPYFRTASHLKFHVQSLHKKEKPHECTLCGKCFVRLYNYKRHIRKVHNIAV